MASTSAFEIVFAAVVETVDVPADAGEAPAAGAGDGEGAEAPFAEPADGEGADEAAAPVTLAACLEPKMAETMFPKTLIFSSYFFALAFRPAPGFPLPSKKVAPERGRMQVKERFAALTK